MVYTTFPTEQRELGTDRLFLKDGSKTKQFGRFYGLDTTGKYYGFTEEQMKDKLTSNKFYEIFAGRDSLAQLSMNYGMSERRIGYSYVRTGADTKQRPYMMLGKGTWRSNWCI